MSSIEMPEKPAQQQVVVVEADEAETAQMIPTEVVMGTARPTYITAMMPAPGFVNATPGINRAVPISQWSSGVCSCFDDVNSLIESVFCHYCQASRQYNQITYGANTIEPWSCMLPLLTNIIIGAPVGSILMVWMLRNKLRARYQIVGSELDDCIVSTCVPQLALAQQYREMSLRGEWTSGACINEPYTISMPAVCVMGQVSH